MRSLTRRLLLRTITRGGRLRGSHFAPALQAGLAIAQVGRRIRSHDADFPDRVSQRFSETPSSLVQYASS
jgi:hypothetical protein